MLKYAPMGQEPPFFHRQIACDLPHPRLMRMGRDASHRDLSTPQMQEKQDVIRHEPPSVHTSAVKKSVATKTSMCVRMNSFHVVVVLRSGAGAMPWRLRMLPTV